MKFYKPNIALLILDVVSMLLIFGIVLGWFPLTTPIPFIKYSNFLLLFAFVWIVFSYFFRRYTKRTPGYFKATLRLFYVTVSSWIFLWILIQLFYDGIFSERVLFVITVGVFTLEYLILFIYYAYRYAVNYDTPLNISDETPRKKAKLIPAESIDDEQYENLVSLVKSFSGEKDFKFLQQTSDLRSGNVRVFFGNDLNELKLIRNYTYSTFVQLEKLNNMRMINAMFNQMNHKLADDGILICCFESKSTRKKNILNKYPKGINYIVYTFDFFIKRVIPRIFFTRRLYYDITGGKKRIFSKAEVLGRLYYNGFEVIDNKKINNLNYVVARRIKSPLLLEKRTYGPLIRLPRVGKNGKHFNVYKMRTMHPYSEYLQSYVFEKNNLQEGGKIKRDIRITTLGHCMRKYWLDEVPMILNLLKREMKIVGVRPLSQHYFSLYSKELQEERIKFKPGLLPPFYADMPKTLDEIQDSEMRYLKMCEKKGVFSTDIHYFFRILNNILFKKARSA